MAEERAVNSYPTGTKGLSGSAIKYIAIIAMTFDHIAWLFVPTTSVLGQIIHFFGRITAPVMAYFITEGFHYTRDLRKYFLRLGIFAVISQFAYNYYKTGDLLKISNMSVITTLFLGLLALWIYNSEKIPKYLKVPAIVLILMLSRKCDWGERIIWFVLAFEIPRGDRRSQMISYAGTAFVLKILPVLKDAFEDPAILNYNWFIFGVLLPVPLLMLYSGQRGKGGKFSKWVFYVFYPLHLLIIAFIRYRLN